MLDLPGLIRPGWQNRAFGMPMGDSCHIAAMRHKRAGSVQVTQHDSGNKSDRCRSCQQCECTTECLSSSPFPSMYLFARRSHLAMCWQSNENLQWLLPPMPSRLNVAAEASCLSGGLLPRSSHLINLVYPVSRIHGSRLLHTHAQSTNQCIE